MKMTTIAVGAAIGILLGAAELRGREPMITALDRSGRITWTSPSLNVTCRVQWAACPGGDGYASWSNHPPIFVTSPSNETPADIESLEAAMYRVVCAVPDPHFPDITAAQSLALLNHRGQDPDFAVLDVRTPGEYLTRHIIGALNIDYFSSTFIADLDALDKDTVYLLHCASGGRSGQVHDDMLSLGFHEVYNMLYGLGAFQGVPGADAYLEP